MASVDRRPDGKWRARWREYPGGPQRAKHFGRKIDAERFLVDVQHRLLSGVYTPPSAGRITVRSTRRSGWVGRWRQWRESTRDRYERELRLHIVSQLGDWPIASLRREHVEAWVAGLSLAPSSAALAAQTLGTMLSCAVEDGRIPVNPVSGARLPTLEAAPFVPLAVDDIRLLAQHMVDHVRAAVPVTAGTGLRQGELFGLVVDRVDFLRRELRVDQQLWSPKRGRPVLRPVKSRNSYRTVSISGVVVEALAAHIEMFGTGERGVIFHVEGRCIGRSTGWKYAAKAGVASGLGRMVPVEGEPARKRYEGPSWHDNRHHHASMLLSHGVSPGLVAERLGHDVKTLLRTYAHVIRTDDDRVRSIVDDSLGESAEDWLRTG